MTPAGWRVDPINGDLLGGVASGSLWGSTVTTPAADARGESSGRIQRPGRPRRAERRGRRSCHLRGVKVDGFGTLRLAGTLGETLHATGDLHVAGARVGGLAVSELKVPAVLATTGGSGSGTLHVRRYSARIAGGHVHGDALVHIGADRAFQGDIVLTDVDLESIARIESEARRPASGKISGRVTLHGHDARSTRSYRGRVNLTLDDASLVALPVFRELDKFLGSARGGLFEAGRPHGHDRQPRAGHRVGDAPGPARAVARQRHGRFRRPAQPRSPRQHEPAHPPGRHRARLGDPRASGATSEPAGDP